MGMWISSIILTPIAIYLTYKATNDSSLLDTDWYYGRYKYYTELLKSRLPQKWQDWLNRKQKK
jgi:lipopolysaccharide export system permease protein